MLTYAGAGWQVFDAGWPDMMLAREVDDKVILRFVEEKSGSRSFSTQQKNLLLLLERAGLDVFIILEGVTGREFPPSVYFNLEKTQKLTSGLAGTTIRNYRVKLRQLEAQLADIERFDPMYDVTLGRINKLRVALGEGEIEKISEWTPEAIEARKKEKLKQLKLDPEVVKELEREKESDKALEEMMKLANDAIGGDTNEGPGKTANSVDKAAGGNSGT
jgi:hypothetical protein